MNPFPDETLADVATVIVPKGVNINNVITFDVKIQLTDAKALQLKAKITANVTI